MLQKISSVFVVYRRKTLTGSPDPTHANGTDKPCITDIPQVQPVAPLVQYSVIASFSGAPILKNVSTILCSLSNPNRSNMVLRGIHLYNFFLKKNLESYIGASLYTHAVPCLLPQRFSINLTINLPKFSHWRSLLMKKRRNAKKTRDVRRKKKKNRSLSKRGNFKKRKKKDG